MQTIINQALKIFLSPWIDNSSFAQVVVDEDISESQIANFIKGLNGVHSVTDVSLSIYQIDQSVTITPTNNKGQVKSAPGKQQITPSPGTLFVSSAKHQITTVTYA